MLQWNARLTALLTVLVLIAAAFGCFEIDFLHLGW